MVINLAEMLVLKDFAVLPMKQYGKCLCLFVSSRESILVSLSWLQSNSCKHALNDQIGAIE